MIKKLVYGIINTISVLIIAAAVFVLIVVLLTKPGKAPSIVGFTLFRITTGSMAPTYDIDSMIVVKEADPSEIQKGDVISFYSSDPALDGAVNTHRVVEIEQDEDQYIYTTKGDGNNVADPYKVKSEYLIGKVIWSSVLLGKISRLASNPLIFIPVILVPLAVILLTNFVQTISLARKIAKEEEETAIREALRQLREKNAQENREKMRNKIRDLEINQIITSSKEEQFLKSANIEIDSLDILQELFGINDKLIRVIENRLGVSITQRNSCITISGTNDGRIRSAVNIIKAMQEALGKQQQLSVDMIHRFLDETEEEDDNEDGIADSTRRVLGDAVTLNYKNIPIRTKTIGQKNYITALKNNTVTICIGPAGTGKTYLAVAYAAELYRNDEIERIILSRPAIEAGEKLGFLPGDLQEKVDPYLKPLYDALNDVFGPDQAAKLRERGIIEVAPLAYMRGRTLNNSMIIIDESQNATLPILKMALTRIGTGSKMILTGDVTQIDLSKETDSGLQKCASILKNVDDIATISLTNRDVVRCKIVKDIVKAFEKEEAKALEKTQKRAARRTSR